MEQWSKEKLIKTVEKAKTGDRSAIEALAYQYGRRLQYSARIHTRNEADANDVLQNAWIRIIKFLPDIDDPSKFLPWSIQIVSKLAYNFYHDSKLRENTVVFADLGEEDDEGSNLEFDPEDETIESRPDLTLSEDERRNIILRILDSLPDDQRMVITMHYYDDMSLKDISEDLGIPMSTVTGRYQKAKKAIKAKVSEMQKREGMRLYGLSPLAFFLYLLRLDETYIGSSASVGTAISGAATTTATSASVSSGAATSTAASTSSTAAASTANVAKSTAAKTATGFWTAGKIGGAVAVVTAVSAYPVYNAVSNSMKPKSVDISQYLNVVSEGYNGYGVASVSYKDTGNEKLNEILSSGYCTVDNSGILTNGSYAHIACQYDLQSALDSGYEITGLESDVLINGLELTQEIDLFDGVTVYWDVNQDEHTANIELNTPDTFSGLVSYEIKNADETGNVMVHANADLASLHHDGYEVAGNQFDKFYSIGNAPETFMNERLDCIESGGEWSSNAHACIMPMQISNSGNPASQSTPAPAETMSEQGQAIVNAAYAQLGSTDLCSLVVNNALHAIGVDCFIGDPYVGYYIDTETIRSRGYWVATPQPGDVAYYSSNYSGTSSHVAIYIGNGQVISGNYNGSTQIVAAYIGGQQSQPQYYRYY